MLVVVVVVAWHQEDVCVYEVHRLRSLSMDLCSIVLCFVCSVLSSGFTTAASDWHKHLAASGTVRSVTRPWNDVAASRQCRHMDRHASSVFSASLLQMPNSIMYSVMGKILFKSILKIKKTLKKFLKYKIEYFPETILKFKKNIKYYFVFKK